MRKMSLLAGILLILISSPWAMSLTSAQTDPPPTNALTCSFTQFETGIDAGTDVPAVLNLSGDGSRLAVSYLSNEFSPAIGFLVYDVASQTLIFDGSQNTSWGDIDYSGNHFVYIYSGQLFYWDNGVISQITDNPNDSEFGAPQISDDGTTVVFSANGSLVGDPRSGRFIYIWDTVNGLRKLIDEPRIGEASNYTDVILSGDGSTVAFLHDASLNGQSGLGETQIYLWDAVNGPRLMAAFSEAVSPYPYAFHINVDGSRIAFTDGIDPLGMNAGGDDEIFIWDAATGLQQITQWDFDSSLQSVSFAFDASGNRLFFYSAQPYGNTPDGGHFFYDEGFGYAQITFTALIGWPTWGNSLSADGQKLAVLIPVGWDESSNAAPFMEIFIGDCTSPNALPAPSNLAMEFITHFSLNLTWEDNASDETAYVIERSYDGIDWVNVAEVPADSVSYTDTDLFCGITYFYRLRAYRASDNQYSEYSNIPSDFIACLHLFAPEDMTLTSLEGNSISFTWTEKNLSETAYFVERSLDGSNWTQIAGLEASSVSYSDSNLACDTDYFYRVRAFRAADSQYSPYSSVLTAQTPPCLALNAPTNIALTNSTENSLSLSWTDNSQLESAYFVERSQDGSTWEILTTLPPDSTSFDSLGLSCSSAYQYRLRTVDYATNSYSPYGVSDFFETDACPALIPSVLSSTGATETSISLAWTVDTSATSFTLAYYDGLAWQNLGIFPATTTSYSHTGLSCGQNYQYKLTSYRANDNSTVESELFAASTSVCPAPNTPDAPLVLGSDLSAISLQIPALPVGAVSMTLEQSSDGNNWLSLGTVSTGSYIAGNLLCGTSYHYRLMAYASNGLASAPSASTSAATQACPLPSLIGVYRAGLWTIVSSDNPSVVLNSFTFGDATWQPIVGDWDGDGIEGIGIYRNGEFILKQLPSADSPEIHLNFGLAEDGWQAIAGDWNGDGIDSIGLYKNGLFSLSDDNQSEAYRFDIGVQGGWMAAAGDWNGDGSDGVAVYKQGNWQLVDSVTNPANIQSLSYGPNQGGWQIIVGDWNSDNSDSIGLFKAGAWRIRTNTIYDATEISLVFGQEGDIPFVIKGSASASIIVIP